MNRYYLVLDVGGSHVRSAVADAVARKLVDGSSAYQEEIDAGASVSEVVASLCRAVAVVQARFHGRLSGVGVAVPGPFLYDRGISSIFGVEKFDGLFGLNLRRELGKVTDLPLVFLNDATAYALGEVSVRACGATERNVVLTLGTGLGSTFLEGAAPLDETTCGVPPKGYLYNVPFRGAMAESQFSTRWFVDRWNSVPDREPVPGVKRLAELARAGNNEAQALFDVFADAFAAFVTEWISPFAPQRIVLGGNISRAADRFLPRAAARLRATGSSIAVETSRLWDDAPLVGAAIHTHDRLSRSSRKEGVRRCTDQFEAPLRWKPTPAGAYDIYPSFPVGEGRIRAGIPALAESMSGCRTVTIDGYQGVAWDELAEALGNEFRRRGVDVRIYSVDAAMRDAGRIERMVAPYLGGDDPLFGRITDLHLSDWFSSERLQAIRPDPDAPLNVLLGCGAALAGWDGPLFYVDLPKNELQFRMRAGRVGNLGMNGRKSVQQTYKHFFFVDWVVLNRHKADLLGRIDWIVDGQRETDAVVMMSGDTLREGLTRMGRNFFRVRPWFEPGTWGGSWMKEHIGGLNRDVKNLAWSFELMTCENGVMFDGDGYRLEVSFDFLMYNSSRDILGDCADRFGCDFPIRFDFLDTFDGGNLSIQCHPRPEYIRTHFGMPFTQDETYYILDCQHRPHVYLGFQEGIDPEEFRAELERSGRTGEPVDIGRFVQRHDASRHDLFLIPNGTIHASGKDCLVLEISSAPYIFTFKMYDWVRPGLDGKPRPLNIARGMENLRFERCGDRVRRELVSRPRVVYREEGLTTEELPTHPDHFYAIRRHTFSTAFSARTEGKCRVCMVVEGRAVEIETAEGMRQRFNYAETFVIPAAAGHYVLRNLGAEEVKVVEAYVK